MSNRYYCSANELTSFSRLENDFYRRKFMSLIYCHIILAKLLKIPLFRLQPVPDSFLYKFVSIGWQTTFAVASSISRILIFFRSALARQNSCCWPVDKLSPNFSRSFSSFFGKSWANFSSCTCRRASWFHWLTVYQHKCWKFETRRK